MSVRHINVAIIPCDDSLPLSTLSLVCPGPSAPTPLALPDLLLPHLSPSSIPPSCASTVASFPLRRYDGASPSVHLYALSPTSSPPLPKNVRATTLAFSCGLHSTRLRGDVAVCRVVGEGGGVGGAVASDFDHGEIVVRPDLRVRYAEGGGAQTKAPEWLEGAAQANYSYKTCHFCSPSCASSAWSHACVCDTWREYKSRGRTLKEFNGIGDWTGETTACSFETSAEPYRLWLEGRGLLGVGWWSCELDGWSGGMSGSAASVRPCRDRVGRDEGFGLHGTEDHDMLGDAFRPVDWGRGCDTDDVGLPQLEDWGGYYALRAVPAESPIALLLHFPLTLYHGLRTFARAQVAAAGMLGKRVAVHIVGVEKELNFLDMFDEVFALFERSGVKLDLAFIVRPDMLPPRSEATVIDKGGGNVIRVVVGSYNDGLSPDFDIGSGKPDVVFGMNAGLYAYDSWRHVVDYLRESGTTGIFTDYNEWSGVNCASLGGKKSRDSLQINPFRQPLALPVYSMNLPQFANGFFYCFNEPELDE